MEREDPWDQNDGEELEAQIMQADHAFGSDLPGTTPGEESLGLSLDEALARERPEGRGPIDEIVAVEDDGALDVESELVADGSIENDAFASPEEAALSIRDGAPGATDHEDPHSFD